MKRPLYTAFKDLDGIWKIQLQKGLADFKNKTEAVKFSNIMKGFENETKR